MEPARRCRNPTVFVSPGFLLSGGDHESCRANAAEGAVPCTFGLRANVGEHTWGGSCREDGIRLGGAAALHRKTHQDRGEERKPPNATVLTREGRVKS
jgi:hypothetical protein